MNVLRVVFAGALLSAGGSYLAGQETPRPDVFTLDQAEAGRTAYEKSCGQCHTYTLRGRKGEAGELPALESLPAPYLKFIGPAKRVPPLMGSDFARKYSQKTMAQMFSLFRGAADTTPVSVMHMSDETLVNITAYILQMNGGTPGNQALTKASAVPFGSVAVVK
jgi:mono/diheme cytochrome c family protein